MKVRRFAARLEYSLMGLLALTSFGASPAVAQDHGALHSGSQRGDLVRLVRESTARFRDPAAAEAEEYFLMFGCVSGDLSGAMGMHFVKFELVGDGEVDATRPEIVIYEPTSSGRLRLIGADYLVLKADWEAKHPGEGPPQVMGQLFHLFESPNRFGLPDFYTLHVWAWKDNPTGAFVNWHSKVSCEGFNGQN